MKFDIEQPGLIILSQFKTLNKEDTINHYFYISSDGLEHYYNSLGSLNSLNIDKSLLLNLIKSNYKKQFEFALDKVDLGHFHHWTTLQIQLYHDNRRSHYNNVSRFLEKHQIKHQFDNTQFIYHLENFPHITTQKDLYFFINDVITHELALLFKKENVMTCYINDDDFSIWKDYENKIEFLEKIRMKHKLEQNLSEKIPLKNKKI